MLIYRRIEKQVNIINQYFKSNVIIKTVKPDFYVYKFCNQIRVINKKELMGIYNTVK
jgi:hypothetical protein